MRFLCGRVADLVKRHPALFLPYVAADLLAICIWRLRGLAEKGIFQWFTTKHSVLGGPVSSTRLDPDTFAKAAIAYTPIGIGSIIAVVWLFVAALVWTAVMVDVFENEQRPDARDILTRVVARWRTILLFALRFLLTFGVFSAVTGGLTYSLLFLVHRQEFLTSYWLVAGMMVLPVGGAAWLVMPAALRLLGEDASATVATKTKLQGTILALAAMEAGVALGFLLSNLEGPMLINSQWERIAISAVNSIVANGPDALLFVALTLIRIESQTGNRNDGSNFRAFLPVLMPMHFDQGGGPREGSLQLGKNRRRVNNRLLGHNALRG